MNTARALAGLLVLAVIAVPGTMANGDGGSECEPQAIDGASEECGPCDGPTGDGFFLAFVEKDRCPEIPVFPTTFAAVAAIGIASAGYMLMRHRK